MEREQKEKILMGMLDVVRQNGADMNAGDLMDVLAASACGHFAALAEEHKKPLLLVEFATLFIDRFKSVAAKTLIDLMMSDATTQAVDIVNKGEMH